MLKVRKATMQDAGEVFALYDEIIDHYWREISEPSWKKGVYPTQEYLADAIREGTLYVGLQEDGMAAGMILNHHADSGYEGTAWSLEAPEEQVWMVHTLGVHPRATHRGTGQQMVREAMRLGREQGIRTIRLDVIEGNQRANRLYEAVGFRPVRRVRMDCGGETGWREFTLYEYIL